MSNNVPAPPTSAPFTANAEPQNTAVIPAPPTPANTPSSALQLTAIPAPPVSTEDQPQHGNGSPYTVVNPVIAESVGVGAVNYREAIREQEASNEEALYEAVWASDKVQEYYKNAYAIAPAFVPAASRPMLFGKEDLIGLTRGKRYSPYIKKEIHSLFDAIDHHLAIARQLAEEDRKVAGGATVAADRAARAAVANRNAQRKFRARTAVADDIPEMVAALDKARQEWKEAKAKVDTLTKQWREYVAERKAVYTKLLAEVDKQALDYAMKKKQEADALMAQMAAAGVAKPTEGEQ